MTSKSVAIMIAVCATSAAAQPVPIQPSVDSAEQRQALRAVVGCLAKARPTWARQTLAYPYLSKEQARSAGQALSGRDKCVPGNDTELTFRTSSIISNLAEYFMRADLEKTDLRQLTSSLNTVPSRNASEDFALCVASRAPALARELSLSEPGSRSESEAANQLSLNISQCVRQGEQLTVDTQALRALMSIALYRTATTRTASRD